MPHHNAVPPNRPSRPLGSYDIYGTIGEGGSGKILLGEHRLLLRQAAVKVLLPLSTPESIKDFQKEAQLIASLNHPNIVRVFDFGVDDGTPFLAMELSSQGSLRRRHPPGTRVPLPLVVTYLRQIAAGLQYAHDHNIIHRDVKLGNLLIGDDDRILISDFGIAINAFLPNGSIQGTVAYMAPEQIDGHSVSQSDQYAAAVVAYELLSGRLPFTGTHDEMLEQHLYKTPPSLHRRVLGIPKAVEAVVMKALSKDPNQRYESMAAFASAFEAASQPPRPRQRLQMPTHPRPRRRDVFPPRLLVSGIVLFLLIFGALAFFLPLPLATISVAPKSIVLTSGYDMFASNNADSSEPQVHTRVVHDGTEPASAAASATGTKHDPATQAQGDVTFFNSSNVRQIMSAGTVIIDKHNGVQVITDAVADIPPANLHTSSFGSATVPAHALQSGPNGNIAVDDLQQPFNVTIQVDNVIAFSGGRDEQQYSVVRADDIDKVKNTLIAKLEPSCLHLLQAETSSSEALAETIYYMPYITPRHQINDTTESVQAKGIVVCTGVLYDQEAAQHVAIMQFLRDKSSLIGSGYFTIKIIPRITRAIVSDMIQGIVMLHIEVAGKWAYQLTSTVQLQLSEGVAGQSREAASAWLRKQPFLSTSPMRVSPFVGNIMPYNPYQIRVIIIVPSY